jgi:hypothetical protein
VKGRYLTNCEHGFADSETVLADSGYQLKFAESPPDRVKSSASITIASVCRIGQLTVWSVGEAELSMGDADSGPVKAYSGWLTLISTKILLQANGRVVKVSSLHGKILGGRADGHRLRRRVRPASI